MTEPCDPDELIRTLAGGACTGLRVRMVARRMTSLYDRVLEPSGLTAPQFGLLLALSVGRDLPMNRLAEALAMDRTTLSRNLKLLIDQGYAALSDGRDRRVKAPHLTPAGRTALEAALPYWRKAQALLGEQLGSPLAGDLHAALGGALERLKE